MTRYNLIEEKWIPVVLLDGNRDELGIRETLLRSKEIAAIEHSSPLVVAALHRFLLAVLYRSLEGPADIDEARALFADGLPSRKIIEYLKEWKDRFWLMDDKYPFMQVAGFEPKEWKAWSVLAAEHNSDNSKVLFDHLSINGPGDISDGASVLWLLAAQTFAVSSGKSEFVYTKNAPSATAVMAIPIGINLQDTLLYSLVPQNRNIFAEDMAIWEREPETRESLREGIERTPNGFADLYAWRSRSIFMENNESGGTKRLAFASGVGLKPTDQIDPMLGYRIDEKIGRLPIQFRERGFWRDFDSLLPDASGLAPRVIQHAVLLTRRQSDRFPSTVLILGQAQAKDAKAKIDFWRMERFALPKILEGDREVRSEIRWLLDKTENSQKSLWLACRTFARALLSRGDREPEGKDVKKFVRGLPAIAQYWTAMESPFHDLLSLYAGESDRDEIRRRWLQSIRNALGDAWNQQFASSATSDAWTIRALALSEVHVLKELKRLQTEIKQYETNKEGS